MLAAALIASLARAASFDADVGLRTDARSSTFTASGVTDTTRASLSAAPSVTLVGEALHLRLGTTYTPRLWTSDVERQPSPFVSHALDASLETRHDGPWRAEATASGIRGRTDPLADPLRAAAAAAEGQVPTTEALLYEALRAGMAGALSLGLRTALTAGAVWQVSRGMGADAALLPLQRGVTAEASLSHLVTERNTFRFTLRSTGTITDATAARARAGAAGAVAAWRRRLTPSLEGWLGGGAALTYSDLRPPGQRLEVRPGGELGFARSGAEMVSVQFISRATTFIDRFSGEVTPFVDGLCVVGWRADERLSFSVSASGGARTDGDTALAVSELRAVWALREPLRLEAGVHGRWQYDRRPERPSFVQVGAFLGMTLRRERIFRSAEPLPAPTP